MFPFYLSIPLSTTLAKHEVLAVLKKVNGPNKKLTIGNDGKYELEPEFSISSPMLIPHIQAKINGEKVILEFQNPWFLIPAFAIGAQGVYQWIKEPDKFEWRYLLYYLVMVLLVTLGLNLISVLSSLWFILDLRHRLKGKL